VLQGERLSVLESCLGRAASIETGFVAALIDNYLKSNGYGLTVNPID
jgi:hypothetical protein